MQPLISPVDHESRHNVHRTDEEEHGASEETPLLHRFPMNNVPHDSHVTTGIVALLIIILISGIVIGIYLLVIQNNSENILPPIAIPLQLVIRTQWDTKNNSLPGHALASFKARQVIVVQTDTEKCYEMNSCIELLQNMKGNSTSSFLPFNFLVSSNGQTFEALGWRRLSPLFPQHYTPSLVLAFIGNFTTLPPTCEQIDEAKNLFAESVSLQHLHSSYVIIGKKTNFVPRYLFRSLSELPQWDSALSDAY